MVTKLLKVPVSFSMVIILDSSSGTEPTLKVILSVPKFTANLYCICFSKICGILKQMQYRFAVNFGTLSTCPV